MEAKGASKMEKRNIVVGTMLMEKMAAKVVLEGLELNEVRIKKLVEIAHNNLGLNSYDMWEVRVNLFLKNELAANIAGLVSSVMERVEAAMKKDREAKRLEAAKNEQFVKSFATGSDAEFHAFIRREADRQLQEMHRQAHESAVFMHNQFFNQF